MSDRIADTHAEEVQRGDRFEFGRNWSQFLKTLDEERIAVAEESLRSMLGVKSLDNMSFLDIGSGSGLFSLAARRLGARVYSFDYDPESVGCTRHLRERYFPGDESWHVEKASVLDEDYIQGLELHDIVYSWGVLHQTGEMWKALGLVATRVCVGGQLFISIYNDQGGRSRRWRLLKRWYNRSPRWLQWPIVLAVGGYWETRSALIRLVRFQNPLPFADWARKKKSRGMSVWHDLVDWVGGYPHEVAKPEEILDFFTERGFTLLRMTTQGGGHGCNEFVFLNKPADR